MKEKPVQINAVLEEEIEKILRRTKYYEDFLSGKFNCEICGQVINEKNIGVILPILKGNEIELKFYCEGFECIDKYYNSK